MFSIKKNETDLKEFNSEAAITKAKSQTLDDERYFEHCVYATSNKRNRILPSC